LLVLFEIFWVCREKLAQTTLLSASVVSGRRFLEISVFKGKEKRRKSQYAQMFVNILKCNKLLI